VSPSPRLAVPALEAGTVGGGAVSVPGAPASSRHLDDVLARGRLRASLTMLGPAFVAAVAYVDPGNFATNIEGGARFGYLLLWVVVLANLVAMLIQFLSAKLGIVTDRDLPELCRESFAKPVSWALWIQAELMAMATDIAELLGAALGLNLLFGVPLLSAGLIGAVIAFAILELQRRGHRGFELAITALLGLVLIGFLYEALRVGPSVHASLGGLVPNFSGTSSLYLAVGIVGATVMPHAIYLHSALTKGRVRVRDESQRRRVLRFARIDVVIALGLAGVINMAMLVVAAKLFHGHAVVGSGTIQQAHTQLGHVAGGAAALAFSVALMASGVSSSSVGTYAGQVVMAGFINIRIPVLVRRAVTMIPALVVLALSVSPTSALVASQVALSFGIPFALIPLAILTSKRELMGVHVNGRVTRLAAYAIAALITAMNGFLIVSQLAG
jgi:manganese transport protein